MGWKEICIFCTFRFEKNGHFWDQNRKRRLCVEFYGRAANAAEAGEKFKKNRCRAESSALMVEKGCRTCLPEGARFGGIGTSIFSFPLRRHDQPPIPVATRSRLPTTKHGRELSQRSPSFFFVHVFRVRNFQLSCNKGFGNECRKNNESMDEAKYSLFFLHSLLVKFPYPLGV